MNDLLNTIINWSEAWALLIPLIVIIIYRPGEPGTKPLIIYVFAAFILNTIAAIMVQFYFSMPAWLKNNNILYNVHSLLRVILFSWYLTKIRHYRFPVIQKILLGACLIFVLVNFVFMESPFFLSSNLFAAESIVLLSICLLFFFRSMQDDNEINWLKHPAFLVCTGICLYEATSFFIFLFFYPLFEKNPEFGDLTMSIHNVMYVILCIILALALYKSEKSSAKPVNQNNI